MSEPARTCPRCGASFTAPAQYAYCSPDCRRLAAYEAARAEALSLADLERYGNVWGTGTERRALCPYCDHPKHDHEHATLAFNVDTGAWTCHRCHRSGKLAEHWPAPEPGEAPAPRRQRGRRRPTPAASAPPREPSPEERAEAAKKRDRLRRLWTATIALDEPLAEGGRVYLGRRGIPAAVAVAARVCFADLWSNGKGYSGPAVAFPIQDEAGRLVAAEARYLVPPAGVAKANTAGPKSRGVFVAYPDALADNWPVLCEGPLTALSVAACGLHAVALGGQTAPAWLARRLALRDVVIALDEGEAATETSAAKLIRALAEVGARPYRLRWPAGVDANDRLQAVGLDALRRELWAAFGALTT